MQKELKLLQYQLKLFFLTLLLPAMRNYPCPHEGSKCAEEDSHGERFGST